MSHTCNVCVGADVILIPEVVPWSAEHWMCPKCDSTYDISCYPLHEWTCNINFPTAPCVCDCKFKKEDT